MAIDCRRDAQLGRAAVQLGNHHPAHRIEPVAPLQQRLADIGPLHLQLTQRSLRLEIVM